MCRVSNQTLKLPKSRFLGSLTYPVYLIHANIGFILINKFATDDNKFMVYLAVLAAIIMISFTMNKVIEVKGHHLWKRWFNATQGAGINKLQAQVEAQLETMQDRLDIAPNAINRP